MMLEKRVLRLMVLAIGMLPVMAGCARKGVGPPGLPPGATVESAGMAEIHAKAAAAVMAAPPGVMEEGGLVGVLGGVHLKFLEAGPHEVLLPIPQLTGTQVPLFCAITSAPPEAAAKCRVLLRDGSNAVFVVRLDGNRDQEIRLEWSSVVLLIEAPGAPDLRDPERYLNATACVQSGAKAVKSLAGSLWPADGRIDRYAANIQAHIRGMKQEKPPRSLDAEGILASGANWICTANANLAAALLRAKEIPARTLAVVPPISQRLEMHRIVECYDGGRWHRFDSSSLHADIPMKPWQSVVMARTTIADEEASMKPRMGSSPGAPYGQELELLTPGVTLWGDDFFWTMSKPLAGFEAGEEAADLARGAWELFLKTGAPAPNQIESAWASDAGDFIKALQGRE